MARQLDICRMTLLYVDEDRESRLNMKEMIFKNYPAQKLLLAENGVDALFKNRKFRPDIYVIDLGLTYLDGFSLIDELLFLDRKKEIIAISESKDRIGVDKQKNEIKYIFKPFASSVLYSNIDTCMENVFWSRVAAHKARRMRY